MRFYVYTSGNPGYISAEVAVRSTARPNLSSRRSIERIDRSDAHGRSIERTALR